MEPSSSPPLWALVLAGGDGTRLQALTRRIAGVPIPKQYCRLLDDRSLLEATFDRIAPLVPASRTAVVVNRGHLPLAAPQLGAIPSRNVVVQPRNRETGPGMLLGLLHLAARDPAATVAVFPSDHHVRYEVAFRRSVARMAALVRRHPDRIALLGARPDAPDPGLGYIAPGVALGEHGATDGFTVRAFHEKPAPALARRIIRRGAVWNTFVMVFRVDRMLALLRTVLPQQVAVLEPLPADPGALAARYDALAPWNFSRDFLERMAPALMVLPGDGLGWSDWGTPDAIERTLRHMGRIPPWATPVRATA